MSEWTKVTSGIPQGSVIGPILFIVFINELPDVVACNTLLFADDTKVYRTVQTIADCHKPQAGIYHLQSWAEKWQMKFHPHKCTDMRIGSRHPDCTYQMNAAGTTVDLDTALLEKYLGIHLNNNLKFDKHVQQAVNRSNRMGVIRRSYTHLDKVSYLHLYKAMVRPILEYAVTVWAPYRQGDIAAIERIQRRATRMLPELKGLPYEDRLCRLRPNFDLSQAKGGHNKCIQAYTHGLCTPGRSFQMFQMAQR